MAKHLPKDEWDKIRERWELDPRPGYRWVVGEMNLTVTESAVKARARKERWTKRTSLKAIVDRAQQQADKRRPEKKPAGTFQQCETSAEQISIDLRSEIIDLHRGEWAEHRSRFPLDAIVIEAPEEPGRITIAPNGEKIARASKVMAETIRLRQQGEREAWGLDAISQDEGAGMSTLDELDAMFELAMRRTEEMKASVRKERGQGGTEAD
ncbi:MAG: hypothetical protein K9L88_08015 [Chromatiaceae bacterium]|nr:hypothetical protein [Chromatiaceae bacterium]